jgi:hypothetical protein
MTMAPQIIIQSPGQSISSQHELDDQVPLPILLRVPRFSIAGAAEPITCRLPAMAWDEKQLPKAPCHRRVWPSLLGALLVAAIMLTPSMVIHWNDWGMGPILAHIEATLHSGQTDADANESDADDSPEPAEDDEAEYGQAPAAQLAPYIIPLENGGHVQ